MESPATNPTHPNLVSGPSMSAPIKTPALAERLVVHIHDLAFGGEGVARVDDFVLFVAFTLPGETVEVEVYEVKKRFGRARLLKVIEASPDRVTAECPHYGLCGGCQYQHLAYPRQLELKRKQVADIVQRIGGFNEAVVDEVIPCPHPYEYRNRIMVRSQWDKFKQGLNIGFIRADCGLVIDVENCKIAMPEVNEALRHARANPPPKGGLKVLLRHTPSGWHIPRDAFFQNNTFMLEHLIAAARRGLSESGVRFLIDAYCGVGFFSLELASQVEGFVGVEYDRQAVKAARENAISRGITSGEYLAGATEELMSEILRRFPAEDTAIVLDPPRAGCAADGLMKLKEHRIQQILYVSCHPATLARDLQLLCQDGLYRLVRITPVDMFPQTAHIECVADLRLSQPQTCG